MKVKTADLIGTPLDWAVAQCEGETLSQAPLSFQIKNYGCLQRPHLGNWKPSVRWSQGGPIIEQKGINLSIDYQDDVLSEDMVQIGWKANLWNNSVPGTAGFLQWSCGPTPLIAAMRCLVALRFGDEVDIPEELLK